MRCVAIIHVPLRFKKDFLEDISIFNQIYIVKSQNKSFLLKWKRNLYLLLLNISLPLLFEPKCKS